MTSVRARRRAALACLVALAVPALAAPGRAAAPSASMLRQQETQQQARERVAQAEAALEGSTLAVRSAAAALDAVAAELPAAQADAADARGALDGARAREATAVASARRAQDVAVAARQQVDAATGRVAGGRVAVAQLARRSYQQGPLADLRTMMSAASPQDLLDRSSLLKQVFRSQNDSLLLLSRQRLALARTQNTLARELEGAERAQQEADRVAARALAVAQRADTAQARVRDLVARRGVALRQAEQARAGDAREYQAAQAASKALAERIRAAAARARAAERARAAARARERARARAAAAAAAAAGRKPRPIPPAEPSRPQPSRDGRWQWPADGPLTSRYGYRTHPIYGDVRFHAGIDIGAPYGSLTRAAEDGVVTYAGSANGYGTLVLISHGTIGGHDITSGYAHQSQLLVREGQFVRKGQAVGRVGNEGNSTGPHLHFEVRRDGDPVDPLDWVTPP